MRLMQKMGTFPLIFVFSLYLWTVFCNIMQNFDIYRSFSA